MKQILQSYKGGELWVADVPAPAVMEQGVLIQTGFSVVSAGTERMILELAQKSLLGKARSRPDLVKKVLSKIQTEGLRATWEKVSAKLDDPIALGYSSAGTVVEVGRKVSGLEVGQQVACGGAGYAVHAEYNAVPANLCAVVPQGVGLDEAAFTTIGAIALQGVRQADVKLGESVAVIGLGLIGLLTVQMLKASGCKVLGSDPDEDRCRLAKALGADDATATYFSQTVSGMTEGRGVDAVVITAATTSNEPVEKAAEISRAKGRVVAVGLVGMDVPREAYYRKELDLRLSMSYGPGRYDVDYEERGRDYPYAYVRWTEQRNMQAFLSLVGAGCVTPSKLITHRYPVEKALEAYDLLLKGATDESTEKPLGVVLDYGRSASGTVPRRGVRLREVEGSEGFGIGLLGAGNFAGGVLLPALKRRADISLVGVCTATGASGVKTGKRAGFAYATTDPAKIMDDVGVGAVMIATRHDSHAQLVCDGLMARKHVFVEKPLAITPEGLQRVESAYNAMVVGSGGESTGPALMVGFNRRFSGHAQEVRQVFAGHTTPMVVNYRINAGAIPRESWVQDPDQGGGRIIGEVCHFVDLCSYLTGSPPVRVHAASVSSGDARVVSEDSVSVTLYHADGSMSCIQYIALGDPSLPKERIEVFAEGKVAVIDNFISTTFHGIRRRAIKGKQDKGFDAELDAFFTAVRKGGDLPIPLESLLTTTRVTFAAIESLKTGNIVNV